MLVYLLVTSITDLLSGYFINHIEKYSIWYIYILEYIYFIFKMLMIVMYCLYNLESAESCYRRNRKLWVVITIPAVFGLVLLAINTFTNVIFKIDKVNGFVRGKLIGVIYAISIFYITKTIPQGITALINFIPDSTPEDNEQRMSAEISTVKTGQVTYAVRDTVIDDKEIKQDDFMGIGDSGILSVGQNLEPTVMDMMKQLVDEDSAIVSIYYGEDTKEEDANALGEKIGEAFPDVEIEVHYGGQQIYYYVISVE